VKRLNCPHPERDAGEHNDDSDPTDDVDQEAYLEVIERISDD